MDLSSTRGAKRRPGGAAQEAHVFDSHLRAYLATREALRRLKPSPSPCFARDWSPPQCGRAAPLTPGQPALTT